MATLKCVAIFQKREVDITFFKDFYFSQVRWLRKEKEGRWVNTEFVARLFWLLSNNRFCLRQNRKRAGMSYYVISWNGAEVCKNPAQNNFRTAGLMT